MTVVFLAPHASLRISGNEFSAGVGGTVAAIILMAETLSRQRWEVVVASAVDQEDEWRGVRYVPTATAGNISCELLILINTWGEIADTITAKKRVFLYFDTRLAGGQDTSKCVRWADHTLVNSPFSVRQLALGLVPELAGRVDVMSIPIRVDDYADLPLERPNRLLYSSMPDRGLVHLARWFPAIRRYVPNAELHVTGDFSMYGWPDAQGEYARCFQGIRGVNYHGRVTRPELVDLQRTAKVLAYPCTFAEGFCIAAAEAMAAGAVPVTSDAFALRTTVGASGVLIPGHPGGGRRRTIQRWLYGKRFVREVVHLLTDPKHWRAKADTCRRAAQGYSPQAWYDEFVRLMPPTRLPAKAS